MDTGYLKELKEGYLDTDDVMKVDFVLKYPQLLAKSFGTATPRLSTKQSRSFFDAFNKIYLDVIGKKISMAEAKVELAMLSTKINDKFNKGTVPEDFKTFIDANVAVINDKNDFKAFMYHFEAICNYLKDTKETKTQNSNSNNGSGRNNNNNFRNDRNNGGYRR